MVAKTLRKEGLGCLSHMASGTTRRQCTFWKGELVGKTLLLALESITVLTPVTIKETYETMIRNYTLAQNKQKHAASCRTQHGA